MRTSKPLKTSYEMFLGLVPGNTISLNRTSKASVIAAFNEWAERRNKKGTERLEVWSIPESAADAEIADKVFALICTGMSQADIEQKRGSVAAHASADSYIYAPLKEGFKAENASMRMSRRGWELMEIGECKICRLNHADLRVFIGKAMVSRGLDYEFRLTRMRVLENAGQVWRVERIK